MKSHAHMGLHTQLYTFLYAGLGVSVMPTCILICTFKHAAYIISCKTIIVIVLVVAFNTTVALPALRLC